MTRPKSTDLPRAVAMATTMAPHTFTPTRAAGLARLQAFLPRAGRAYAERRNFDLGPDRRDNVSMLSPWIRHRLVREDEVASSVLMLHSHRAAEKFIQEVVWRTYWKGWLEMRPSVWRRYRQAVADAVRDLDRDGGLRRRFEEATSGRTGIDCFDAWAHELCTRGYLHNHARMWFASIWIFTLRLPWVLGADFFFRHLIDGDPAANTLSWRWVAGLQTPGKTYLARSDNIARYTGGRFDPGQRLAAEAVALAEPEPLPQPAGLPAVADRCPDEPVLMLIGEDDCDPLSLGVSPDLVRAAAAVVLTERRSPLPVGEAARRFSKGACADGLARVSAASACATAMLDRTAAPAALLDLASSAGAAHVVAGYAPVGPTAEWLAEAEPALAAAGVRLTRLRRPWDAALWPHARKGYFAFKEKVPSALLALGIGNGRGDR